MTGPERLRESCKNFIVSNFSVVLDAPDWPEMESEELADFIAMSELCVESEMKLWQKVALFKLLYIIIIELDLICLSLSNFNSNIMIRRGRG